VTVTVATGAVTATNVWYVISSVTYDDLADDQTGAYVTNVTCVTAGTYESGMAETTVT
jgi:hypothetical protein